MKAGIITFQRAINYGAALQAYALKTTLETIVDCEVVDYVSNMDIFGSRINKNSPKEFVNSSIRYLFNRIVYRKRIDNFKKFAESMNYIGKKQFKINSNEELMEKEYDFFITGSDQVFFPGIIRGDFNYLLGFTDQKCKKYSYAASFGSLKPEMINDAWKKHLLSFNSLSIREDNDANTLSQILEKQVDSHIDPVFLLSKNEWEKIATPPKHENYILIYTMRKSETLIEYAENLSKKTGAKIVYVPTGLKRQANFCYEVDAGPSEFLGLFLNARYVITNSFHGTAFSTILHKQMIVEFHTERNNTNHRFQKLINLFSLQDRILSKDKTPDIDKYIDFDAIDKAINKEKGHSKDYLDDIYNKFLKSQK